MSILSGVILKIIFIVYFKVLLDSLERSSVVVSSLLNRYTFMMRRLMELPFISLQSLVTLTLLSKPLLEAKSLKTLNFKFQNYEYSIL